MAWRKATVQSLPTKAMATSKNSIVHRIVVSVYLKNSDTSLSYQQTTAWPFFAYQTCQDQCENAKKFMRLSDGFPVVLLILPFLRKVTTQPFLDLTEYSICAVTLCKTSSISYVPLCTVHIHAQDLLRNTSHMLFFIV